MKAFGPLETACLTPVQEGMQKIAQRNSTDLGPVIVAMSGLYVIIQGFALMRGQRHFGAADMIASCLKIAIIVTVAGGAGTYLEYVAIPLSKTIPDALVGSIGSAMGSTEAVGGGTQDKLSAGIAVVSEKVWAGSSWYNGSAFKAFGLWLILWGCAGYL